MISTLTFPNYDASASTVMYAEASAITADSFGVKWGLFDIEGWNNAEAVRQAVYERPFQDGAVLDAFSYGPRVMDIHGGLVAPTRALAMAAVRRLKGSFEVRDSSYGNTLRRLFVDEFIDPATHSTDCFIDVRRADAIQIVPSVYGRAVEFSVPVIAPDPRKYARNQQHITLTNATAAPLVITSQGDTPTWVEVIITGPITNPKVTHDRTSWFVAFIGSLTGAQSVGFSTRTHAAGGTLGTDNVNRQSRWFPILPGVNNLQLSGTGTTSATKLEAFYFDAYQ